MAEPFSFFDTTLDKPKEDYTSALLGKKPKENAFASPQVNPMMAQTQILGQAPVAQASGGAAMVGEPQVFQGLPWGPQEPGTLRAALGTAPAPTTAELLKGIGGFAAGNDPNFEYTRTPEQVAQAAERARLDIAANQVEGEPPLNLLGQILATPGQMAKNADEFFGSAMRYFTPKEELGYTPPTGGDVLATAGIRAPGGYIYGSPGRTEAITKPQDQKEYDQLAAGERAFATGEGLGSASSVDMGTGVAASTVADMAPIDPNSPQASFLMEKERLGGQPMTNDQIAQATRLAASMGTTFDPETGYSRDAFLAGEPAPRTNNLTTVGGAPLNEFLSGAAMPDQGFARAENAMYGDNSLSRGLGGDVATKAFQDASMAREARLGFDNRPGVDVPSLAMQRSRMDAGLDPVEGAPTGTDMSQQQQRDALERGFDPATGQAIQGGDGMTEKDLADIRKTEAETAKILSSITENVDTSNWTAGQTQAMKTQAKELSEWEIKELPKLENNLTSLNAVVKALSDGQIKSGGIGDQIPGLSNWARPFLNPDAEVAQQQVAGVIMQTLKETFPGAISNEERKALISTVYNPQLKPDKNAELVGGYADRLNKAMNAKKQQVAHFRKYGSLESYTGITPRDALMEGINTGSGSGGSPIQGDVDYVSSTQSKAADILNPQ